LKAHVGRETTRAANTARRIAKQVEAYKIARKTKGNAEAVLATYNRECTRLGVPVCKTTDALRRRFPEWKKRGLL
jgi:hypothetical protein